MVRSGGIAALILLWLVGVVPGFATGPSLHEVVPQALGMGQAYTALARGPLAPLWNPAGIGNLSGLHGTLAVALSAEGNGILFGGGCLAAPEGLSGALTIAQGVDEGAALGTLAFPVFRGASVGVGFCRTTHADSHEMSFAAGVLYRGTSWSLGVSAFHLGAELLGGDLPVRLHVGASLEVVPGSLLALDLHLGATDSKVALGVETKVRMFDLRWGTSISLNGRLSHVGLGVGFTLFDFPVDLSFGLVGPDQKLWMSGEAEGAIPLW